jgi:NAD(P)-dependent dehydrogenase (short-subunit alcohol dehydrogenase family)
MFLAVVTGANRGIGLALTRALREQDSVAVLAACRKASADLSKLEVEVVEDVDVSTDEGLEKLANAVGDRHVDLLINNAGILTASDRLEALDVPSIRAQFEVNALGPLRVTAALRSNLRRGSKVALVTSRMGSIGDNTSGGFYGYRMSKAALNMAGVSLAHDLRAAGVAVAILHPGMVKTDMVGSHGQVEPHVAAQQLLARIGELTLETSGSFWHANGERLPW